MLRETKHNIPIYDEAAFAKMRAACKLAAECLDYITNYVKVGVSTLALDDLIHAFVLENGATPATLGYKGYPKSSCISVNHVICHGIPDERKILKEGDILNIDVTAILDGWYGDTSRMFYAGTPKPKSQKLCDVTYDCLMRSIDVVKPGATLGDIGHAIQSYAESHRFSVVRDFCGHGIGQSFHTEPQVVHFGKPGEGTVLEKGMIFTIEPMINLGRHEMKVLSDGWTAVTRDKQHSAQFEHTIGVTDDGAEIFTLSPKGLHKPPYNV